MTSASSSSTHRPASEPALVSIRLPAPLPLVTRIISTLEDAFPGSTVRMGSSLDVTVTDSVPDTDPADLPSAEVEAGDADVDSTLTLAPPAHGDLAFSADAEVASLLVSAFEGVLSRHDAPNFVTMTLGDGVDCFEVEVRRAAGVSAAERIAELEAEVARLRAG